MNQAPKSDVSVTAQVLTQRAQQLQAEIDTARSTLHQLLDTSQQRHIACNVDTARTRYTVYARQSETTAFRLQVARAAFEICSARRHVRCAKDELESHAAAGVDPVIRSRIRIDAEQAERELGEALALLDSARGVGTPSGADPLQRFWQDAARAAPPVSGGLPVRMPHCWCHWTERLGQPAGHRRPPRPGARGRRRASGPRD